ncbi:hypothetical protein VB715_18485 [Crocosphaera sp. UHCC 0190]|uniref:hypothetical protein n=1 Tax=Crocosphaera sp. UHCC 0190 TaxID=3110246 RepID=UPI002B1F3410|nr:hypothetical protein [Crocosphaera sp. UHCC 0190]MEA5511763.1 hypothetical protein [Crocosphaera sp. UHCC 0190]
MDNPVGELMGMIQKYRLKKPDFQFKKNQGQWQCTCVITLEDTQLRETALGATKKEVKTQTAMAIVPILKEHLQKVH